MILVQVIILFKMAIVDLTKYFDGFEMAFSVFGIGLADLHKGFNSFEMGFCGFN